MLDRKISERELLEEFGEIGLRRWAGRVTDEFLAELRGPRGRRVFREMAENDPTIGAILFAFRQFCLSATFSIEPGGDSKDDLLAAALAEKVLETMEPDFYAFFLPEALSFIVFGFAIFEKVYSLEDGLFILKKLAPRVQESIVKWELSQEGEVLGCYQYSPAKGGYIFLPKWKILHIVAPGSASYGPEGRSFLRNAYVPWYFKKNLQILEGIGIERDLCGYPVFYVPSNVLKDKEKSQQLREQLASLRRDEQEGLLLPKDPISNTRIYELELLAARGTRQFSTTEIIERYNREIAHTLLADLILVGLDVRGSYALAREKRNLFELTVKAFLDTIAFAFNKQVIAQLTELNFPDLKKPPRLEVILPKRPSLDELAKILGALGRVKPDFANDPAFQDWLRKVLDIPIGG